ncbi:developmental pluripotency-associated protein 4-like [Heteronotia binoei]|uniref:developmental pluripotency-associated protein 4-like n=1 Tax=Heteronotia binoei TaxID=13085 RepID=UPI002931CD0C|nr:developmental pluripotency-associated protein 4-like [Heteronotia binoei]
MPRQSRKQTKPTATPQPVATPRTNPQVKSRPSSLVNGTTSINYKVLKRSELQHHCKELGLRATGKNTELVERLQAFHVKPQLKPPGAVREAAKKTEECHQTAKTPLAVPRSALLQKIKSEPAEDKREVVEGWCVVHGMALYRPSSSWAPLLLQRGSVYVQDGKNLIPFHLQPLNIPVPDGLLDNHICRECVLRNQENPRKGCHHACCSQDFLSSKITLKYSTSRPSALPSCASKIRGRTTQSRKSYRPQEDEAYAQRVEGILFQMAHGELGMDQVLHPLQPLVVHSPAPFNQ